MAQFGIFQSEKKEIFSGQMKYDVFILVKQK